MPKHPILGGLAALVVIGGIATACHSSSDGGATAAPGAPSSASDLDRSLASLPATTAPPTLTIPTTPPTTPPSTPAPVVVTPPAPASPAGTASQRQALAKASDYLAFAAFSRTGLIKQLAFDGFTTADATWAVDRVGADWTAQAATKAKDYLDYSHFSRSGLIAQLKFDGFTTAQATAGASAAGL